MKNLKHFQTVFCLLTILVLAISCSSNSNSGDTSESYPEEVAEESAEVIEQMADAPEEVEAVKVLSAADSASLNDYINELKGIDKFFVRESYKRLLKLFERKEDDRLDNIRNILEGVELDEPDYIIGLYEPKNGYLVYEPGPVSVMIDMVYWNVSDNSQLIAIQTRSCGPVCDLEISFLSYKEGTYTELDTNDVIPDLTMLSKKLVPEYDPDDKNADPIEFRFMLPRKGKDLKYCVDSNCVNLKWMDGKFVL